MGDNPVDNKAVDVLAAAAGVPTPAQAKTAWRYRKLALIVGGAGLVAVGGGFGYKHFTAAPPRANAQDDPPAVAANPDDAKPPAPVDDTAASGIRPPAGPVKDDLLPSIADVKIPAPPPMPVGDPVVKPAVASDRTETGPAPVLPPTPMGDEKKPVKEEYTILPPPAPDPTLPPNDRPKPEPKLSDLIQVPDTAPPIAPPKPGAPVGDEVKTPALPPRNADTKRPAAGEPDFKAVDPVPTIGTVKVGPGTLPDTVDGKTEKDGPPVIRVDAVNPPAAPKIPAVDIPIPPPPAPPGSPGDSPIVAPPGPVKDDMTPGVTRPGPRADVPPVVINPLQGTPAEVKTPDLPPLRIDPPTGDPIRPPGSIDPPVGTPRIDTKVDPPPVAPPAKTDSYDETWHEDRGETFAAISREYFHDPRYAAALEAYNRNRRDKIIRVPPTWVLKDRFPNLIRETPDGTDKPVGGGLKFQPVAPLPSGGRSTPPAAVTSRATDEYKVTSESGEMIRDVARKALGDATAWKKLYELNPGIDPTLPIPAGTILRLK